MSGAKGPVSDGPAIRRLDSFMDQIYNKFNELFGQGVCDHAFTLGLGPWC